MESVEVLNNRLRDNYGRFENGEALWRIVYSEDEFEKRIVTHTSEGFELLNPMIDIRPKYRQYITDKFILERLLPIPEGVQTDLIAKTSYEPVWVFQDKDQNKMPPKWEVCQIVINSVLEASARAVGAEYKHPDAHLSSDELKEKRRAELKTMQEELFGNETAVGDALAYGYGVTVPGEVKNNGSEPV